MRALAGDIGPRHHGRPDALRAAERYVRESLAAPGYAVQEQAYAAGGGQARNFIAALPGASSAGPVLVVGAHYDTVPGTPGADDNASGVAALLELGSRFRGREPGRVELRFVAFGTEEPPHFGGEEMGSVVHARSLKAEGREVLGMASLEMLGYYDERPGSQRYPPPLSLFYPDTADYIGLVSNLASRRFLKDFAAGFKPPRGTRAISAALPGWVGEIALSDNSSYWNEGFPAVMVTDTSFLRYPHYHAATDTPEKLDYARMADVVDGLEAAIERLRR